MEGVVAQLSDGRVMMNIRNEGSEHRRAVSYSPNGATNWSVPKFDPNLREPICFGSLLAVPREIAGADGVVLFSNPDNVRPRRQDRSRALWRPKKRHRQVER